MIAYHPKITAPRLHKIVPRNRLFRLIDGLGDSPVTWVSSPAGSGKTALMAGYIQARKIPALWYRMDETDGDVASFFYHMRGAAGRLKGGRTKPLPLFTPEYRPGIATYTRNFFETLFSRMTVPGAVVFDNYQDVPEESDLHGALAIGLKRAPEGIRVFLISKKPHPPPFISLKAKSMLASLDWEDLRFTLDETRELIRLRKREPVSEEAVQRIHEEANGWAAAIVLMTGEKKRPLPEQANGHDSVFNYLAVEVFDGFAEQIKRFLLCTALLPGIAPDIASQLTGNPDSARILDQLYRQHNFTDRYGSEYRYHPLFREFLLFTAEQTMDREEKHALQRRAGQILLGSGQEEKAIGLLADGADWDAFISTVLRHAPALIAEGRNQTLEKWIESIPEEMRTRSPWLSYWTGMCRLSHDPAASHPLFENSFDSFRRNNDATGVLLAWAGVVNSISYETRGLQRLSRWIEWLDEYLAARPAFPSPEVEASVVSAMVGAIIWAQPYRADAMAWLDRALDLGTAAANPSIQRQSRLHIFLPYMWLGDYGRAAMLINECEDAANALEPFHAIWWRFNKAVFINQTGSADESALPVVEEGLRVSEDTGVVYWTPFLLAEGFSAAMANGDSEDAIGYLKRMEAMLGGPPKVVNVRYHCAAGLYHLHAGNMPAARTHGEQALAHATEIGFVFGEAFTHLMCSLIHGEADRLEDARQHLAAYHRLRKIPSPILEYTCLIAEAALAFHEDRSDGPEILKKALALGKKEGYVSPFPLWIPSIMARLCRFALAAGIETRHVQYIIRSRNLVSHEPPVYTDTWPWHIKIVTFGGFEIQVDDEPLVFAGKIQKRPLTLLKALIALGGKDVGQQEIEDLLWPESEGDVARIAFKTTVSRLRKLLKGENMIEVKQGKVSLNRNRVWVDTWAFEEVTEQVFALPLKRDTRVDESDELASRVTRYYKGEFLSADDESWISPCRDRFRSKFLRAVRKLGDIFNEIGQNGKAAGLHEQAIDRGLSPEEIHGPAAP